MQAEQLTETSKLENWTHVMNHYRPVLPGWSANSKASVIVTGGLSGHPS
jgi:hypothetical protein